MKKVNVITIDGPAGSGKSTLAKALSKELGFTHIDSGAIYRAIGVACSLMGINLEDEGAVLKAASSLNVEMKGERVIVNGDDLTERIREPEAGLLASKVARFKGIRDIVVRIVREISKGKRIVIDGRDAGSYIFPDAELKVFLTASPQERAKRRFEELKRKGFNVSYEDILREVMERDRSDRTRKFAPLVVPEGAVVIDTTDKSFNEVLEEVKGLADP